MEMGHDDFRSGNAFLLVDVGGHSTAIIGDRHRPIGIQANLDLVAEPGQRFVDGVVDDLVHHVVQARAVVGIANVHAGPLAHGIEASQHLDRLGAVLVTAVLFRQFYRFIHSIRFRWSYPGSPRPDRR